ncbi:copper resistance protein NlpE N-terminal domain-containing protein [Foetidibacter luteolus]|uniref:copper resistance protein NlpE N-terminal domain-containing protein n=1 Tax=Foetidibacter luteolus TaxID=2608880 RepID=UPI00129ADB6F|nr:copper resistance protein NlpE N-terminal domain-containing protein [Foetidibacter luteolus]
MKLHTNFFLLLMLLAACNNDTANKTTADSTAVATIQADTITMQEVEGVYKDTLPCADCPGIVTTLQLSSDSTYITEHQYIGKKKEDLFYTLGRWSLKDSIVKLSGIKDGPAAYKASLNSLLQLDMEGKEITGSNLNYTLRRGPSKSFEPKINIPVEGMFVYYADAHLFTLCATGKTYPAALTKETVKMESAYSALKKADKEPLLANVEGIFEMRPGMEEGSRQQTFVIKKFIKFLPGEKCK